MLFSLQAVHIHLDAPLLIILQREALALIPSETSYNTCVFCSMIFFQIVEKVIVKNIRTIAKDKARLVNF